MKSCNGFYTFLLLFPLNSCPTNSLSLQRFPQITQRASEPAEYNTLLKKVWPGRCIGVILGILISDYIFKKLDQRKSGEIVEASPEEKEFVYEVLRQRGVPNYHFIKIIKVIPHGSYNNLCANCTANTI